MAYPPPIPISSMSSDGDCVVSGEMDCVKKPTYPRIIQAEHLDDGDCLYMSGFNLLSVIKRVVFGSLDRDLPPQADFRALRVACGFKLSKGFTVTDMKLYLIGLLTQGRISRYRWVTCGQCDRLNKLFLSTGWKDGDNVIVIGRAPKRNEREELLRAMRDALRWDPEMRSSRYPIKTVRVVKSGKTRLRPMVVVPDGSEHAFHLQASVYRKKTVTMSKGPGHAVGVSFRQGAQGLVATMYDPGMKVAKPLTMENWATSMMTTEQMFFFDIELP
jgi:hypothetical protein